MQRLLDEARIAGRVGRQRRRARACDRKEFQMNWYCEQDTSQQRGNVRKHTILCLAVTFAVR